MPKIHERLALFGNNNNIFKSAGALFFAGSVALTGCGIQENTVDKATSAEKITSDPYDGECYPSFADSVVRSTLNHRGFKEGIDYQIVAESAIEDMVGEPGVNAFTQDPINSEEEFIRQISSNISAVQALRQELISGSGDSIEEITNTGRIVFVKFNNGVTYTENTQYKNGQIIDVGKTSFDGTDAAIFYVSEKACDIFVRDLVDRGTNDSKTLEESQSYIFGYRAGCLNPILKPIPLRDKSISQPVPQPTYHPPQPVPESVPQPTYHPPQPVPQPTYPPQLTPKEPSKDVQINPYIPPQVSGPGVPNYNPPQPPVDSGNGGVPIPPPPSFEHPPSGPGSGDMLPAPTEVPSPAEGAPDDNNPASGNPSDF